MMVGPACTTPSSCSAGHSSSQLSVWDPAPFCNFGSDGAIERADEQWASWSTRPVITLEGTRLPWCSSGPP